MKITSTAIRVLLTAGALGVTLCRSALGAPDLAGARPGDEAMGCEQIATELVPYMQQVQPSLQALATSQQEQYARGRERLDERKRQHELLAPLATAGALDPTGASKRAYVAAELAQSAKEKAENEADANSPLAKRADAQRAQVAARGMQLNGDARLQRLMQLGQQKGCTKGRR